MKFTFKCGKCSETFSISKLFMPEKQHVQCQNCGQELPEDILKNLRDAATSYNMAQEKLFELSKNNYSRSGPAWTLTVQDY